MSRGHRAAAFWLAVGAVGVALVPWYAVPDSIWSLDWIAHWHTKENGPAWLHASSFGRAWLWPVAAFLAAGTGALAIARSESRANALIAIGALGFTYTLGQGFVIGPTGWYFESLKALLPALAAGQYGMGLGAFFALSAFAMLFSLGLAGRGDFRGDAFVAEAQSASPCWSRYSRFSRIQNSDFGSAGCERDTLLGAFSRRMFTEKVWGVGCVIGATRCGVAWNTLILAFSCAIACTGLGLAFALIWSRTTFRYKKMLRFLSVLPIITPPFVIGLSLILIFGRSGVINQFVEYAFGVQLGRWIYGLQGVLLAQVFAFTPIAFLVLIGVVEGVSPSMEEAAQTLRANRWRVFNDISLPLMRPGLANAFLISFIESIADFGNPILLGGNFGVLSTEVFFSVVGAQLDQGRAATLGILLLAFALAAFFAQRWVLGRKVYTSLAGKGDSGLPTQLPDRVRRLCYGVAIPWSALTLIIYVMALVGGFVETWGRDYSLTLKHYAKAFAIEWTSHGILWAGAAWNSFWTTIKLSALAAPLTAALGILSAYLLTRQTFKGKAAFEFGTMLSFAIPGTVIGVSYILAFNVPPIEITGTGIVLIICFIFRNMPVGVRAGMAANDPDRQEPGRGIGYAWRARIHDAAASDSAAPEARDCRSACLQLRACGHHGIRCHLPRLGGARDGHHLYHQSRGKRRLRRRYRLLLSADRADASRDLVDTTCRRRAAARATRAGCGASAGARRARRSVTATNPTENRCPMKAASIEFHDVSKRYGDVTAVRNVSFAIAPRTLVTLLGPSGCGKTTILRMIAGLELPTSGVIHIGDVDVTKVPAAERDVSMVFQSYALFPHMTVEENVGYGLSVSGVAKGAAREKGNAALATVGLTGLGTRLPSELSGGQQQRVAVARALVLEPSVLLFDEPLSNLDARLRRQMREEIRDLQQRLGLTVVYVTHDQSEALAVSDRIIVMDRAVIAQEGAPRELYAQPKDAFVAGFMGEANRVRGTLRRRDATVGDVALGPLTVPVHTVDYQTARSMLQFVRGDSSRARGRVTARGRRAQGRVSWLHDGIHGRDRHWSAFHDRQPCRPSARCRHDCRSGVRATRSDRDTRNDCMRD